MISFVKRATLDVEKYDLCIENSLQSRIYAFSWYLDIVADHWDVLVLNDYEAVMPIPWKQKLGLKYVTQPYFCQQLGIFSLTTISEKEVLEFVYKIPIRFVKTTLNFNSNTNLISKMDLRINYVLKIENSYQENYKNFNKNRKRVLKKCFENKLITKEIEFSTLLNIAREEYHHIGYKKKDYLKLQELKKELEKRNLLILLGAYKKEEFLGGVVFIHYCNKIIYLFSVMNENGKNNNAATFLISEIIKKFSNKKYVLDFEGSMQKNIANFFRSFGSIRENYFQFKTNVIQRIFF
jgi:hypothetical protein